MADATPTPNPTPAPPAADPTGDDGKGGKAAVLADLATERDKRQALEQQVTSLTQAQQAQTDALAKAFGLKPEETSDVSALAQQVTTLQQQFQAGLHENLALRVATENRITEQADIELLKSVTDEQTMRSLAARISKPADGNPQPAPSPRPDLSQGGKADVGTGGDQAERDFASFLHAQTGR